LIEDMEARVRQGVDDAVARRQEVDRKLALLASGRPIG
jgi:hypothetical protein